MRPHHRARWEPWARPGLRANGDDDGAQTCIAWVIDDYRYGDIKDEWKQSSSSPSTRSAVQRLFREGARAVPNARDDMPVAKLTRSRILSDIVAAFGIADDELDEIRAALHSPSAGGTAHMGPSFHDWDTGPRPRRSSGSGPAQPQSHRRSCRLQARQRPDPNRRRHRSVGRADQPSTRCRWVVCSQGDRRRSRHVGRLPPRLPGAGRRRCRDAEWLAITTAVDIDLDQIATTVVEESALYIGMVLGRRPLRSSCGDGPLPPPLHRLGRPPPRWLHLRQALTADGQRWLENYGFVPVTDEDHIWARQTAMPNNRPRRRRLDPCRRLMFRTKPGEERALIEEWINRPRPPQARTTDTCSTMSSTRPTLARTSPTGWPTNLA